VLNYLADGDEQPKTFWLNTSSNDLIKSLLESRATTLQETFEILLEGGGIERALDENVVLERLEKSDDALWSLLVFAGYLKAEQMPIEDPDFVATYKLTIPNREVRSLYAGTFREWMQARLEGSRSSLERLIQALLEGNAKMLEKQLRAFVLNILSYHDLDPDEPERIYQAFVLGLCASLEPAHRVRSNRESGKGRPDVLIVPTRPGRPGVVLELKVATKKKTLEQALEEGAKQVREMAYEQELRAAGAEPVHVFVCAFDGKEVRVEGGVEE
jgi:hypothetical protein